MKIGRPSKYKTDYCDQLMAHMKDGLSFESFAGLIGVHRDTLYEWLKHHQDFSDAKARGEAASRLFWERMGLEGLFTEVVRDENGYRSRSMNAAVYRLNMRNRFGWDVNKPESEEEITAMEF